MPDPRFRTIALFDDYAGVEVGHHPELLAGLANAAVTGSMHSDGRETLLICPSTLLATGTQIVGASVQLLQCGGQSRPSHSAVCDGPKQALAASTNAGVDVLVNLFLDENWSSWPDLLPQSTRLVHVLHRPWEFAARRRWTSSRMNGQVSAIVRESVVLVHTLSGLAQARTFIPAQNLLRASWPAASVAEVRRNFRFASAHRSPKPYAAMIGAAWPYKGIHRLVESLSDGRHQIRLVGQHQGTIPEDLTARFPRARVDWGDGWATSAQLDNLIRGAAVIVFPYRPEFLAHGGASGALAKALAFGKPIIISNWLSEQAPIGSPSVHVIPHDDVSGLGAAIDYVLDNNDDQHMKAGQLLEYVLAEHTYEAHLALIMNSIDVV